MLGQRDGADLDKTVVLNAELRLVGFSGVALIMTKYWPIGEVENGLFLSSALVAESSWGGRLCKLASNKNLSGLKTREWVPYCNERRAVAVIGCTK